MASVEVLGDSSTVDFVFNGSFSKVDVRGVKDRRIIAGYANVADVVDKQNEKVTGEALHRAWKRWSANPDYCMIMLMHTSTPVAKVLFEAVTDSKGNVHQSGVDERGLYLVAEWRDDTVVANRAWDKVESGEMRGFSIGGVRLSKRRECVGDRCFNVLDDMEIYETSAVTKPANEWSVFGMLKGDLMELSKVANMFKESIIAENMVRISKTRGCNCGKYHIVLGKGLEGLKDVFDTPDTRVVEKEVDGVEYVPLFNLALLRPFSIDEEMVITAESDSGGFESSLKSDEPKREGEIMTDEVNENKKVEEKSTIETHVDNVVEDKVEETPVEEPEQKKEEAKVPDGIEAVMAELGKISERLAALEAVKVANTVTETVTDNTGIPPENGSVYSVSSVETVEETPPVEAKPETRGKVPPPSGGSEGFNISDMHGITWEELEDLHPE